MTNKANTIEEIIISILLNQPKKILTAHLEPRWFGKCRRIIEVMQSLAAKGVTVDAFNVADALGGDGGVLAKIVEIQINVFGAKSNFQGYVDSLREIFELRVIGEAITKAQQDIANLEAPSAVLSGLISESMKLVSAEGKKFNYTAKESMRCFVEKLEEIYDTKETGGTGLKTGINALDKSMGGMQPSDLTVVGARPGVGKTAFAVSVLRNVAKSGKRVGFFSIEMSVFQVMSRFTSMEANINAHKLRHADLDEMDYSRLTAATSVISKFDLRICDKPAITIGELAMQARAWAADGGIDVIAVDYLTRLHIDKPSGNQNLDVGVITTELKNIARNLNIPVMVLAQLNRQSASRKDKRPVMSDLRDSGIIEQEADQIIMLYRPEEDEGGSPELILEKNRHGECGIVRVDFEPSTMCWRDKQNDYGAV
ncbi:MAG: replicative DNA helicase [Methylobacter sp.]